MEWPDENHVHSVHPERHVNTKPYSVGDSVTVLIQMKEYVGNVLAKGKNVSGMVQTDSSHCSVPALTMLV